MDEKNSNILAYGLMTLMGISGLLVLIFAFTDTSKDDTFVDILIYWGYLLIFVPTVASIVFPVIAMISDIKGTMGTLIGIGGLVAIFIMS